MRVAYIVARALVLIIEELHRVHNAKDPRHTRELEGIARELEGYTDHGGQARNLPNPSVRP